MNKIAVLILLSLTSCRVLKQPASYSREDFCSPPDYFVTQEAKISLNTDSVLISNASLLQKLSKQNVLLLYAIGSLEDFKLLSSYDKSTEGIYKKTNALNQLQSKILLAQSQINSIAVELDCESERTSQRTDYLDDLNSRRNNRMIVFSVLLGTASSVATTLISNQNIDKSVSIGAGVVGGILGLLTLNPKGKKIDFHHQRNLLRQVWFEEKDNTTFPPFVWFMLNEKSFSNSGQTSILHNLKNRWYTYEFEQSRKSGDNSIIFTEGGLYNSSHLHLRMDLLNQLRASILSFNQNLNYLLIELQKDL